MFYNAAAITMVAPCVTFGEIVELLDNGRTGCVLAGVVYGLSSLVLCHWNIASLYRKRLRKIYNLVEAPMDDRWAHIFFPWCSLCQEFRELKRRGRDPSLGYKGNSDDHPGRREGSNQAGIDDPPLPQLETAPEENVGQLKPSPNDLIEPTMTATPFPPPVHPHDPTSVGDDPSQSKNSTDSIHTTPFPPPVQSQPTSTNTVLNGAPHPNGGFISMTSQFNSGSNSIPAVAFPPQVKIPEINMVASPVPSDQHVTYVAPQPNDAHNMVAGGVSGVGIGQTPAVQQGPVVLVPSVGNPWRSGLFDCFKHPVNGYDFSLFSTFVAAVITLFAPCVTFGQNSEILDSGSTSCVTGGVLYLYLILGIGHWNVGFRYRKRLRDAYGLSETPVTDRIAHIYFPLCALCQEFRELQSRGLDPLLGTYIRMTLNLYY
ncbi:hypothetical protein HHK36_025644 [Tetracentron sinense]|uniref:Uncharacterized protein n=1 Tax=Tetracentron sinense TaxID=13715 RepID=A0A834YJ49_TETSI|nr:hypothetical protein HHK36_025644 [Tetracentron sinense]